MNTLGSSLICVALAAALAAAPAASRAQEPQTKAHASLSLKSSSALVLDQGSGEVIYGKNPRAIVPIASLTKLMTAMVVLDADLDLRETITITDDDVDWLRGSHSRLRVGAALSRDDMLRLALMASENRAASALSRAYPGGRDAFVRAMNAKARALGLDGTRFADATGLSSANLSTAEDLATLAASAHAYPLIREYSTLRGFEVEVAGRPLAFRNTNRLVANPGWEIGLSKTGFINEAGRCLVMQAQFAGRGVIIVLLDSWGSYSRLADAVRIRQWLETASGVKSRMRQPASLKPGAKRSAKSVRAHAS